MNEMLPRWSLDDLYHSLDDDAITRDLAFAKTEAAELATRFEGQIAA